MRFPFFRNRDSVKNGILISIRRTGDGFHPGLFTKNQAMIAYGSISSRCKGENNSESAHKCYDDVEMC